MERPTLSHAETWAALGISRRTFYTRKARGEYDHLLTPEGRISARKLEIHIHGREAMELSRARSVA